MLLGVWRHGSSRRCVQQVTSVMEHHGENQELVILALKILRKFAEAASIPTAAKILAPPVTTNFSRIPPFPCLAPAS